MQRAVKYVGKDDDLLTRLKNDAHASHWHWTEFGAYTDLASHLRSEKQTEFPDKHTSGREFQRWMRHRFAPILLDIDFSEPGATEIVRSVRQIDGGVPLIVISSPGSLRAYSIARMDGADAFFKKSSSNLGSLIGGVEAAFDKMDRWERTLLQFKNKSQSAQLHAKPSRTGCADRS
ncbi:MAG TPA: response regulator [Planctomycetes bacterium]|nr:response regulator [Fuerstiella sp.]HIK92857.1 response regulator [Planctomycetota bacterium]